MERWSNTDVADQMKRSQLNSYTREYSNHRNSWYQACFGSKAEIFEWRSPTQISLGRRAIDVTENECFCFWYTSSLMTSRSS